MQYNLPADLQYVETDEWLRVEGDEAIVGITDYAQSALGDIVFLELPEVGDTFTAGQTYGVIESVKASSDLYAPVDCEVLAVNSPLIDNQESINSDPYGDGWMLRIKITGGTDKLLDVAAYTKSVEERDH